MSNVKAQQALNRVLNDPKYANRRKDPWVQTIEVLPAAANSSNGSGTSQVADDGDFVAVYLTAVVTNTDNVTFVAYPSWPLLVSIEDSGAGRAFMDIPVHLANIAGTAQLPYILPYPKMVERASTISMSVQNFAAATAYNIRLSIHGVKLYGRG